MKRADGYASSTFWTDLLALVLIGVIGAGMHFVWERVMGIPYLRWLAVLVSVNESNWEHVKLGAWPLLVWAIIMLANKGGKLNLREWLMPTAMAIWSAYIVMFSVHAALPEAFGELGMVRYIGSFMLGVAHGIASFRLVEGRPFSNRLWPLGAALIVTIIMMMIVFTYFPPHIPLFMDSATGTYGI